jgi:uncharacterized membrane protein
MKEVEESIEVNVPVSTAYNQWTQFESFPQFMEGVQEVRQLDDKRLHWRAEVGGKEREWDAMINEEVPDQTIAWHSTSGAQNAGKISFAAVGADVTRVTMHMGWDPDGFVESVGGALGFMDRQVESDLKRFKDYIESRGQESGAWRGEIHRGEVGRTGA